MQSNFLWATISFILTIMILSYVLGDNPLYKIASYLFVGVTTGYFSVLLIYQVILPKLIYPLFGGNRQQFIIAIVAFVLCILLLLKLSSYMSGLSALPMALLVGVGSATIISGALMGTLLPQINATSENFALSRNGNFLVGLYTLVGSIATLLFFSYSKVINIKVTNNDSKIFNLIRNFGKLFIGITFGSLFAGVILSALFALMERMDFIITYITNIKNGL